MEFDWDAENTKHLGRQGVQRAEAEQVLGNGPVVAQYRQHDN